MDLIVSVVFYLHKIYSRLLLADWLNKAKELKMTEDNIEKKNERGMSENYE